MNLEKAMEVAEFIKYNLRKDLLTVEIRPMIEALEYFISLAERMKEEKVAIVIADTMIKINKNDFTAPQYFMREEEISQAIIDYLTGEGRYVY